MSTQTKRAAQVPSVDITRFRDVYVLQAELRTFDAQLHNFAQWRDRLAASGRDANSVYREIESRRDQAMTRLQKLSPALPLRPEPGAPAGPRSRVGPAMAPLTPLTFQGQNLSPWFGFSGTVVMGRASEGANDVAQGPLPSSGSIDTVSLADDGTILFGGDLMAKGFWPRTELVYYWLHSWNYLIAFPAPPVTSVLSYRLEIGVQAAVRCDVPVPSLLESFVAVGETSNYAGQAISVDTNVGLPFVADLSQSYRANDSQYDPPHVASDGNWASGYGYIQGSSVVQRSLIVEGGQIPVVAVTVGVSSFQPDVSKVALQDPGLGSSAVYPGLGGPGVVLFYYSPQGLVVHQ